MMRRLLFVVLLTGLVGAAFAAGPPAKEPTAEELLLQRLQKAEQDARKALDGAKLASKNADGEVARLAAVVKQADAAIKKLGETDLLAARMAVSQAQAKAKEAKDEFALADGKRLQALARVRAADSDAAVEKAAATLTVAKKKADELKTVAAEAAAIVEEKKVEVTRLEGLETKAKADKAEAEGKKPEADRNAYEAAADLAAAQKRFNEAEFALRRELQLRALLSRGVQDGKPGKDGKDGRDGRDGKTPSKEEIERAVQAVLEAKDGEVAKLKLRLQILEELGKAEQDLKKLGDQLTAQGKLDVIEWTLGEEEAKPCYKYEGRTYYRVGPIKKGTTKYLYVSPKEKK